MPGSVAPWQLGTKAESERTGVKSHLLGFFPVGLQVISLEFKMEIRKHFELNGNPAHQNLWDATRTVKKMFVALNSHITQGQKSQTNDLGNQGKKSKLNPTYAKK